MGASPERARCLTTNGTAAPRHKRAIAGFNAPSDGQSPTHRQPPPPDRLARAGRPPMGGITPVCSLGFGTPRAIVRVIARTLPLPHSHLSFVKLEPMPVPLPSVPWHPAHVPPSACPSKIRWPNSTWSGDAPGGIGSGLAPAFGWMPSGGNGLPDVAAGDVGGVGAAAAIPVALFPPWKVTCQIRPP